MEFFDKLAKKTTETCKGVTEKTGKIAKEAKLKIKINDNKSKIEDLYQEIGKKVYQKHTADEELCIKKDLEEECAKIDILSSEIDTYHREILELSDIKACVECKETMSKEANFCPKCGAKQPEVEEESECLEAEIVDNNENSNENDNENHNENNNENQECVNGAPQENVEQEQANGSSEEVHTESEETHTENGNIEGNWQETYTEGEITKKENY